MESWVGKDTWYKTKNSNGYIYHSYGVSKDCMIVCAWEDSTGPIHVCLFGH